MLGTRYPTTCPHCGERTEAFLHQGEKIDNGEWHVDFCQKCHQMFEFQVKIVVEARKR